MPRRTKSAQAILDSIEAHGEYHGSMSGDYGWRFMAAARKLEELGEVRIMDSRILQSGEKLYRVVRA